jgi:hypothetical protein
MLSPNPMHSLSPHRRRLDGGDRVCIGLRRSLHDLLLYRRRFYNLHDCNAKHVDSRPKHQRIPSVHTSDPAGARLTPIPSDPPCHTALVGGGGPITRVHHIINSAPSTTSNFLIPRLSRSPCTCCVLYTSSRDLIRGTESS